MNETIGDEMKAAFRAGVAWRVRGKLGFKGYMLCSGAHRAGEGNLLSGEGTRVWERGYAPRRRGINGGYRRRCPLPPVVMMGFFHFFSFDVDSSVVHDV